MAGQSLNVKVDGEEMQLPVDCTLLSLVEQLALTEKRIAVELNVDIVPKSEYSATVLKEGDVVEIVHAIGGG